MGNQNRIMNPHQATEVACGGRVIQMLDVIKIILIVLEVLASITLTVAVLMQSGKEAGLSGAISGNADTYLDKTGNSWDKKLARWTKWIALVWAALGLVLGLI